MLDVAGKLKKSTIDELNGSVAVQMAAAQLLGLNTRRAVGSVEAHRDS